MQAAGAAELFVQFKGVARLRMNASMHVQRTQIPGGYSRGDIVVSKIDFKR